MAINELAVPKHLQHQPLTLIQNCHVFAPEDLGHTDILIGGGKILAVGSGLVPDQPWEMVETIDGSNLRAMPGFIDSHVHITGGGGIGGPELRNRDILLSSITKAGVSTVIGMIGFDCVTRTMEELIAKTRALNIEGVSAYALTGGYELPTPTLLGSVHRDLAFIEQIVGVGEIAISDHRSSQPTIDELKRIAAESRIGGLVGKKSGTLVLHLGEGPGALDPLLRLVNETEIPASQFIPTHVNRNQRLFEQSVRYAVEIGTIDITAGISPALGFPNSTKPSTAVRLALEAGAPIEHLTMSSDSNGNMPVYDDTGVVVGVLVQEVVHLFNEVRDLVKEESIPVELAIQTVTSNVADKYHLHSKGRLRFGKDADILLVDADFNLHSLFARGQKMVHMGEVVVRGTYESQD